MRTKREKQIVGNYQTWKALCKKRGTPFPITLDEWIAAWRSHPEWEDSGYVVKRDPQADWCTSNIHFQPMRAKASNSPRSKDSRTLTVRQWLRELRGEA